MIIRLKILVPSLLFEHLLAFLDIDAWNGHRTNALSAQIVDGRILICRFSILHYPVDTGGFLSSKEFLHLEDA